MDPSLWVCGTVRGARTPKSICDGNLSGGSKSAAMMKSPRNLAEDFSYACHLDCASRATDMERGLEVAAFEIRRDRIIEGSCLELGNFENTFQEQFLFTTQHQFFGGGISLSNLIFGSE